MYAVGGAHLISVLFFIIYHIKYDRDCRLIVYLTY